MLLFKSNIFLIKPFVFILLVGERSQDDSSLPLWAIIVIAVIPLLLIVIVIIIVLIVVIAIKARKQSAAYKFRKNYFVNYLIFIMFFFLQLQNL